MSLKHLFESSSFPSSQTFSLLTFFSLRCPHPCAPVLHHSHVRVTLENPHSTHDASKTEVRDIFALKENAYCSPIRTYKIIIFSRFMSDVASHDCLKKIFNLFFYIVAVTALQHINFNEICEHTACNKPKLKIYCPHPPDKLNELMMQTNYANK